MSFILPFMPNRDKLEEIFSVYIHVGRIQLPAAPAKYYATFFTNEICLDSTIFALSIMFPDY